MDRPGGPHPALVLRPLAIDPGDPWVQIEPSPPPTPTVTATLLSRVTLLKNRILPQMKIRSSFLANAVKTRPGKSCTHTKTS